MLPGPIDGSILYLQNRHRSGNQTLMASTSAVTTIDHSSSLKLLTSSHPGVIDLLDRAGFLLIYRLGYAQLDRHLITALVDRWRPETSTFHLRAGEMTITLADVAVLLGLPIDGAPLSNPETVDYVALCERLLGISPPGEHLWGDETVVATWFREQFEGDIPGDASQIQIEQRARAIILHIITSRLICDHSKSRIWLRWLSFLEDFDVCRQYSWGSAVLAYTYTELTRLALQEISSLGGCLTLVQLWSWTYLPVGRITMKRQVVDLSLPYGARWIGPKSTMNTPRRNLLFYRNELDVLDRDAVSWTPYAHALGELPYLCTASHHLWTARVPIICLGDVAFHLPDRVMRQFGMGQHLPQAPPHYKVNLSTPGEYDMAIETWNHRHMHTQQQQDLILTDEEYYTWYWHITRRYVLRAREPPVEIEQVAEVESYTPRAPLERNVADGIYRALEMVDELSEEVPKRSKGKCLSVKRILQSILGKNKLTRPAPPPPPPPPVVIEAPPAEVEPPPTTLVYQRQRHKSKGKGPSFSEPAAEQFVHGPSQPQPHVSQPSDESSPEDVPLSRRKQKKTPRELKNLRN